MKFENKERPSLIWNERIQIQRWFTKNARNNRYKWEKLSLRYHIISRVDIA